MKGLSLGLLSLLLNGLNYYYQEASKKLQKFNSYQYMLYYSWQTSLCSLFVIFFNSEYQTWLLIWEKGIILKSCLFVITNAVLGCFGQDLLFRIIEKKGGIVLSQVTGLRKLLSICITKVMYR